LEKITNIINGIECEPESGDYLPNINPATGEAYSLVANSNSSDAELAVNAASEAFSSWSNLHSNERSKLLHKLADKIDENQELLATAECIDNGKPITLAKKVDIPRSSLNLRFFADLISKEKPLQFNENGSFNNVVKSPLGVVSTISPWNLPLYLFTWKIAPALAAGNTVVAKPSEVTPMTAFMLGKLAIEAGFPKGVLNIVQGEGSKIGSSIVKHSKVKAISFTGSTQTGKIIAKEAALSLKKFSLEMGGKNPSIVFDDCDYEKTLKIIKNAAFSNQGQICLCGSRILVQETIYEKFKHDLTKDIKKYIIGDPLDEVTQMGAVVSKGHMEKILSHIQIAKDEGAKFLTGGGRVKIKGRCENGFFIEPTLIERLPMNCVTNQTEIFGPIASIMPFKTKEEAINLANSTDYGLAANIHTNSPETAKEVSSKLDFGIVWLNCWLVRDLNTPFGGQKHSGFGREGGDYALNFFSETKNICSLNENLI